MRITTAAQAAKRDADAIRSGVESWALMHAAGRAIAACTLQQYPLARTAHVFAGTGNNGGDAYVVAALLWSAGLDVVLTATGAPATPDALRARAMYDTARGQPQARREHVEGEGTVLGLDGVLGTGQQGPLRQPEADAARSLTDLRRAGATIVALDLPTGLNATTGEVVPGAVHAHHTFALGTMKRGHVISRERCGAITVLDIGLGTFADGNDDAWSLADEATLAPVVPSIGWNAHKGTRGRLAIVGGAHGMAGAVALASEAALRSGVGLLHAHVHSDSVLALQIGVPQAITHEWTRALSDVQAVAIGPGLGRDAASRQLLADVLQQVTQDLDRVPVVLDADALTLIGADSSRITALAANREVVCTPHPGEFARLLGFRVADSLAGRVDQATEFAARTGATVLLKGTPTVVAGPDNTVPIIVPRGTSVLATGGSGDMLTGIVGAMLAQGARGIDAASVAAWTHGRAAELATARAGTVRGITLREVMLEFAEAWRALSPQHGLPLPVLTTLPRAWSDSP